MKKIIVFDLDGVLFDSTKLVNQMLFDLYPTMTTDKVQELLSGNFHDELEKFKKVNPRIPLSEEEKKAYFTKYTKNKVYTPLYDGMKELVTFLHGAGYILVISTSAFAKNALPMLEQTGMIDKFDFIATLEISRSKTEKFKIIKEKYSISNEDMLFITDTVGDIREAKIAEVNTIAVSWGGQDKKYLASERERSNNLVAVVDSVTELRKRIEEFLPL